VDGGVGFGEGLGDDDTFACGEAVGFDDDGDGAGAEVGERGGDFGEDGGGGGGDAVLYEELLGEDFGGFEAGAVGFGAVGGDADFEEGIDEAEGEGDFGADDDELDFFVLGEGDEAWDVVGGDGEAGGVLGDAGVTGCAEHAGAGGGGGEGADEGVFAATGADDEDGARKRHGAKAKRFRRGRQARIGVCAARPAGQGPWRGGWPRGLSLGLWV